MGWGERPTTKATGLQLSPYLSQHDTFRQSVAVEREKPREGRWMPNAEPSLQLLK